MKQRVAPENRSAALRCYHLRKERFAAQRMTSRGKSYQRHPNFTTEDGQRESKRRHSRDSWTERAAWHQQNGKTTRGTDRVLRLKYVDRLILRAEIVALDRELKRAVNSLPPSARSTCIRLRDSLAGFRARLNGEKQVRMTA